MSTFSTVGQDVAWETRSAGALVVAFDADGIWLGAKNEWIRLWKPSVSQNYELEVFGDRSALLYEVGPEGERIERARLDAGQLPRFEITGLHVRDREFMDWRSIDVISSPSEVPRPSKLMLFGYTLVILSALFVLLRRWLGGGKVLRMGVLSRAWSFRRYLKETWWLLLATLLTIVVVPPSHSESWIIEDLRIMEWIYKVNLGEYLARPFGGMFYLILSVWAKLVTPVWLLRLPVALLFVVAASLFVRNFLVDTAGKPLGSKQRAIALLILSISVFGQGEWLRPEIPILSLWMLSLSVATKIQGRSGVNDSRLIFVGLLVGLMVHHPLGIVVALGAATFVVFRTISFSRPAQFSAPRFTMSGVVVAFSIAVVTALFGHNLGSFRRSLVEFRSGSLAHEVNFQLFDRMKDLNNSPLLLSFSVSLCLIALAMFFIQTSIRRMPVSLEYLGHLLPAAFVAFTLLVPAGPWALYFIYLAPLTATLLTAAPFQEAKVSWKSLFSVACVVGALLLRAINQPMAESTFLVVALSGLIGLIGLAFSKELMSALTAAFLLGASLITVAPILESISPSTARSLSEYCNRSPSPGRLLDMHQACLYTWATTDGSQWGDWVNEAVSVSRASEGAYSPVSFSMQRLMGRGEDCGFVSKLLGGHPTAPKHDVKYAHVAHAYVLLSPCTDPPNTGPNLEAVSEVIHGRSHDMNYYRRVLAAILEHREPTAEMRCLNKDRVSSKLIPIDVVVRIDEPNCVVFTEPFTQLNPVNVTWLQFGQ
jgi:hypothetical protein